MHAIVNFIFCVPFIIGLIAPFTLKVSQCQEFFSNFFSFHKFCHPIYKTSQIFLSCRKLSQLMIKLSQNCLNFGGLKEKQPQNVLIVAVFLSVGKICDTESLGAENAIKPLLFYLSVFF